MQSSGSSYEETEQELTTDRERHDGKKRTTGRKRFEDAVLLTLKEEGSHEQRMRVGSGDWRGQGTGCPLQPPERAQPCPPILDSDLHNRQYICMV